MTMKSAHTTLLAIFLVIVIVGVGLFVYYNPSSSGHYTTTVGGSGYQPSTSVIPPSNSSCTVYSGQAVLVAARWFNTSTNQPRQYPAVGETITLYAVNSSGVSAGATASGTSTATTVSISGVSQCTTYVIFASNGIQNDYLNNYTTGYLGTKLNTLYTVTVLNFSEPTVLASNVTYGGTLAKTARFHSITGASGQQTFGITVQAGNNWDSQGPGLLLITYNPQTLNQPTIPGLSPYTGTLPIISSGYQTTNTLSPYYLAQGSQGAVVGFQLQACANNQYSTPTGCAGTSSGGVVPIQVLPKASFTSNEVLGIEWVPGTALFNKVASQLGGIGPKPNQYIGPLNQTVLVGNTITANALQLSTN